MSSQKSFNPIDYCFVWTDDGWYEWDREAAHKRAKAARAAWVKEQKALGTPVKTRCWSMPSQLMSRGGIGSGHPHIELFVTCYLVNVD